MMPNDDAAYTLEVFAHISGVERETILRYQECGFIRPIPDSGGLFDDEALRTLRRIEYLRQTCAVNEAGISLILDLLAEVERLQR